MGTKIELSYGVRSLKEGDIRLDIQCGVIERDHEGGRSQPYFAFVHMAGGGYSGLSIDLPPAEWEKVIGKLQKKLRVLKKGGNHSPRATQSG